jgi:hypothetical protein
MGKKYLSGIKSASNMKHASSVKHASNVKCIPGIICIENMTFALLIIGFILVGYLYYNRVQPNNDQKVIVINAPPLSNAIHPSMGGISTRLDPFNDPYSPPLKADGLFYPPNSGDVRGIPMVGVPINMQTRGLNTEYQQVGILTKSNSQNMENKILPLMGRRIMTGRDKWQYYTISNSGNINTKLPVSVNGKSCTSEYGCDNITNGDAIYVEGYSEIFRVTMYENGLFQYLPAL